MDVYNQIASFTGWPAVVAILIILGGFGYWQMNNRLQHIKEINSELQRQLDESRNQPKKDSSKDKPLPGFSTKKIYFDGANRDFIKECEFGPGADVAKLGLPKDQIAKVMAEGDRIRIQRLSHRGRWVMSVVKYINTSLAQTDKFIPPDTSPNAQGRFIRFIYFEFKACVQNEPQAIQIRLRGPRGDWLKMHGAEDSAAKIVKVSNHKPEIYKDVLGPVQADQPCYISLDILDGPEGETQSIFIRDLKIIEVRK